MHQKILTMWALTTSKDFRITPCIRKIDMPKLFTLGMKDPVDLLAVNVDAFWRQFACMSFDVGGDWAVLLDECKTSLRDGDEDNGRR